MEYFFESEVYDEANFVKCENDKNGFWKFVKTSVDVVFKNEQVDLQEFSENHSSIYIFGNNIAAINQNSFAHDMKTKRYIKMGDSKIFRITPYNALASYLSIVYKIKGEALTFDNKDSTYVKMVDYTKELVKGKYNYASLLIRVELVFQDSIDIEKYYTEKVDTRKYKVVLKIEYYSRG